MGRFLPHSLVFAALLLPVIGTITHAQQRLRIGTTIAASADFHQTDKVSWLKNYYWGNTIGYSGSIGLAAEYQFDRWWGVAAYLDYTASSGHFTQTRQTPDPFGVEVVITKSLAGKDTVIPGTLYRYDACIRYNHINLALMGSRTIFGNDSTYRIGFALGPVLSRTTALNHTSRVDIVQTEPSEGQVRFTNEENLPAENNGSRLFLYDGPIEGQKEWGAALRGGFFASIGTLSGNGLVCTPGIYLDYGLTSILAEPNGWHLASFAGRVDLTIGL